VGIIDGGRVVAEGTPAASKRSIGKDLIVADADRLDPSVVRTLEKLPGVDAVTAEQGRIIVSTTDGPAGLSPVAIALNETSLNVRALTVHSHPR
jgi:ABC-type multidrug transport system ATPase subunit